MGAMKHPVLVAALLWFGCLAAMAAVVEPPEHPDVSGLVEGADLTSPEALGWTTDQYRMARRYSRELWAMAFVDPIVGMASLCLLVFTGAAGWLERKLMSRLSSRLAVDAMFLAAMVLALAAMNFPLEVYRFVREHRYGFATQGFAGWMTDEIKGLLLACIIAMLFLIPVWAAVRRWPRTWWVAGSAIGVVLSVITIAVAPVFIAPLFNTFTPLRDEALKERILDLAHREGIPADNVYEVDASRQSRHDNAYVAGLLGTQRIVLYDTLISAYTPDEVAFVMGHEMGHYVLNHVWKGVALSAAVVILGFFLMHRFLGRTIRALSARLGYDTPASIAAVPLALLLLSAYMFVLQPVSSGVSRYFEHEADVFALATTGDSPEARNVAVSAFQTMAARNLSDPDPPAFIEWWLYSHPSIGSRIRFAAGRH